MAAMPLPIDAHLGELTRAVREYGSAVVLAPPGAGKTTRVPPALDRGLELEGDLVVLQPRRIAARMAAVFVAAQVGEPVGQSVGYEVRFDRKVAAETRIRFVTDGVFVRQLLDDPALHGVGAVVFDEFHERHLNSDLALALVQHARQLRPDLRVVVMSATLDPKPIAAYLDDCPIIETTGRAFPVDIQYSEARSELALERQVCAALRSLVAGGLDGDVLTFLPGAGEIRRAHDAIAELADRNDLEVVALHGDLPINQQEKALAPANRRKVILATNVAETSLTIDGVVAVIDSGLARVARFSPWTGARTLATGKISRASAIQRAGRAGRTRAGCCIRLYDEHDFDTRREHDDPEILRADLAEMLLILKGAGVIDASAAHWFEPPPAPALAAATKLLGRLGALEPDGGLTALGVELVRLPVHPRQSRIAIEAARRGVAKMGCTVAALIGERPIRLEHRGRGLRGNRVTAEAASDSDLVDDAELLVSAMAGGANARMLRQRGLDPAASMAVDRTRQRLERSMGAGYSDDPSLSDEEVDRRLRFAILTGYPDRVAQRRKPKRPAVVFAFGGAGVLDEASAVIEHEFLVAVDAYQRGTGGKRATIVRRASAIESEWLLELFLDDIDDTDELSWNNDRQRVERVRRLSYGAVVIEEQKLTAPSDIDEQLAQTLVADAVRRVGIQRFVDAAALANWRRRVELVSKSRPGLELVPIDDTELSAAVDDLCVGARSFEEVRQRSLLAILRDRVSRESQRAIDTLAPETVSLPGRRRVPVHYEDDRPPWIESRLQDFFGLEQGPSVGGGSVPLVLHLLAPNRRAVQITSDLQGFWQRHYPDIRRQLKRRYPKHRWPEDPR